MMHLTGEMQSHDSMPEMYGATQRHDDSSVTGTQGGVSLHLQCLCDDMDCVGLVDISVGHISEARSVAAWACVDIACHLD